MLLQAQGRWLASPLGLNALLALLKHNHANFGRFEQVNDFAKSNATCKLRNKLFVPLSSEYKTEIKNINNVDIVETNEIINCVSQWANEHVRIKNNLEKDLPTNTDFVLTNISSFKCGWKSRDIAGPVMTVYNSFNYTQDVQYEARLLELPLHDRIFKLVIIVPSEADVLHSLFARLNDEGLQAAVNSIQPVFTANSILRAPLIEFSSKIKVDKDIIGTISNIDLGAMQYGSVNINENGTQLEVLTCLYSPVSDTTAAVVEDKSSEAPFFFALVFNYTPIFTGQYANL